MTSAPARGRAARAVAGARVPAAALPVARVLVDVSLAHLDRPYDYLVAESDTAAALPGARVRVRFAGRLVNGYVLHRLTESEHHGPLGFVDRVVSVEPVLTAEIAELARVVALRYAGSTADVLRLAVPPRHAKAEAEAPVRAPGQASEHAGVIEHPAAGWTRYPAGEAMLSAIRDRRAARAVWQALPGEDWPARLAEAATVAAAAGLGALLIVPDARDLARVDAALTATLGTGRHVTLSADLGPAERYRRFLAVSRGDVRIVAGTRAAVFAPVVQLGLLAVFDDGDDLLAEPRAPYPHARDVLILRSTARCCALIVGGFARTAEAQLLVESGWAQPIVARRPDVRARAPLMAAAGDDYSLGADSAAANARLSPAAFTAARTALQAGAPVLIQVPRRGYLPAVACTRCRRRAQCRQCRGPLALGGPDDTPSCRWCGRPEGRFRCTACGSDRLRAVSVGAGRTAEEIGRAFPGFPVINSSGPRVRATVPDAPALVIATPGAEPTAAAGYGAALLLDGAAMLGRPDLRAAEETLRRWMGAAALVRPAAAGGRVVIGADGSLPVVQALIRWDPVGHAEAELAARRELGFPPAVAMASVEGDEPAVLGVLDRLEIPPDAEVLGPVALDDLDDGAGAALRAATASSGEPPEPRLRALIRAPQPQRKALAAALHAVAAGRSARKEGGGVRIRVDPLDLF
ncbi:MAG TPA: primosomal protein N' [Nakamurella sp.]